MNLRFPLVFFVVGPTNTGKSKLSIQAAKEMGGEIINCDSVQVFESVNIGAAKPTPNELKDVPHHLYSFVKEGETYTAGKYRRDVLDVIKERAAQGVKIFFIVGGSGFYVQALLKGLSKVPPSDPKTRESIERELEIEGRGILFSELMKRDPLYAEKIGGNDPHRLVRALEILRGTNHPTLKHLFESHAPEELPFRYVQIGMRRRKPTLRLSLEERAKKMIKEGLIEEVKELLKKGLSEWGPMNSVGYLETQKYLLEGWTSEKLIESITSSSMKLAKRQTTWFKRDPSIIWFDPDFSMLAPMEYIREVSLLL